MPRTRHGQPGGGRTENVEAFVALLEWAAMGAASAPLVGIIMGSKSDWDTMASAAKALDTLGIAYEVSVMSAHRTPALVDEYVSGAEGRGLEVIIAGAGGAAHLAGVSAARTLLPVLGVPIQSKALNGMDSLLSTVQMPAGVPVGTLAIGNSGATNAGLLAAAILGNKRPEIRAALRKYRDAQTQALLGQTDPRT
jgi:5-(carboxyamino)imidazole ribonucleotide mutase